MIGNRLRAVHHPLFRLVGGIGHGQQRRLDPLRAAKLDDLRQRPLALGFGQIHLRRARKGRRMRAPDAKLRALHKRLGIGHPLAAAKEHFLPSGVIGRQRKDVFRAPRLRKERPNGLPFHQGERNGVQKQVFEAVYRVALRFVDVAHIHNDHLRLLPLERQLQRPRRRLQRFSRVRQIVTGYPRPVVQLGGIHRIHDVARPQKEDVDGLLFAVKRAVFLFAVLAEHDAVQRQQGQR